MLVKPWITNRLKRLMKVRDRLLKKMSRNKSEDNTQVYKTFCTCIATKLKKNKLEYYQKYFATNGKNMRMLWDRGGSREKYNQGSTKSLWAWLYGCGKYLRTTNKKGQLVQLLVFPFLSSRSRHCWRMASTASSTPSAPAPFSSTHSQLSPRSHLATSSLVFLSLSSPLLDATPLFFLPT